MILYDVATALAAREGQVVTVDPVVPSGLIWYWPIEQGGRAPGIYVAPDAATFDIARNSGHFDTHHEHEER